MTTPLYPTFRKRVDDAIQLLISRQVTPWAFFNSGHPLRVKDFNQRDIAYEGIGFEGSPQRVFWTRYIEPFLEDLAIREIQAAVSLSREKNVDARHLLLEVEGLLIAGQYKVFAEMAEIDQRLRGKGFPHSVPVRSIDQETESVKAWIKEFVRSEIAMCQPRPWFETFYERNKFWIKFAGWLLTTLVAVGALKFL